jgi:hypothetical protein
MSDRLMSVRVFKCGHERPENIAYMLGSPYQKKGETGYCRECFSEIRIVRTYETKLSKEEKEFLEKAAKVRKGW